MKKRSEPIILYAVNSVLKFFHIKREQID